jgi:hypothetical protein
MTKAELKILLENIKDKLDLAESILEDTKTELKVIQKGLENENEK